MPDRPRRSKRPLASADAEPTGSTAAQVENAQKDDRSPARTTACPIVGIGSSAGGLEAIRQLLRPLKPTLPYAYVVLQHISPTHKSLLPEILSRETTLEVIPLVSGTRPEAGRVYVVPPNANAMLRDGRLVLEAPDPHSYPKPSINTFFSSLGEELGDAAVGVVLSGTGSDGTVGLKNILAAGGVSIVQDPGTAEHAGMPQSAIEAGVADFILPPARVAQQLEEIQHIVYPDTDPQPGGSFPDELFKRIQNKYKLDFSEYKPGTLWRRLQRRMASTRCGSVAQYMRFVDTHPEEIDALCRDILITVTSFFRDKSAFEALKPFLRDLCISAHRDRGELRVWVAGCATGEEAYTMAFLIRECLDELQLRLPFQIFATDVEPEALKLARAGVYRESLVQGFSGAQLLRYFDRTTDGYEVRKAFKDCIVFARHDLVTDPPFIRVDLISCRNVLIYMNPRLQSKLINRFAFALNPRGLLFLGRSEGLGKGIDELTVLNARERIYRTQKSRRKVTTGHSPLNDPDAYESHESADAEAGKPRLASGAHLKGGLMLGAVADAMRATFALCNLEGSVLHTAGGVERFFRFPVGRAKLNIADILVDEFKSEVMALLYEHKRKRMIVSGRDHVLDDGVYRITLHPVSLESAISGLLLVIEKVRDVAEGELKNLPVAAYVENELISTRENLQAVVEELATANEEMQSLNEEAQASNEELQATNEELEASNEELQATNEELLTVNQELNAKSSELLRLNDEYQSLYNALDFPVIVFDGLLRLHRFNNAAALLPGARRWVLGTNAAELDWPRWMSDLHTRLHAVVDRGESSLDSVSDGVRTYQLQITPSQPDRSAPGTIVLSLIDVTELSDTRRALRESDYFLEELIANTTLALASKDLAGKYRFVNPAFVRTFGLPTGDVTGKTDFDLFPDTFAAALWAGDLATIKQLSKVTEEYAYVAGGEQRSYRVVHQLIRDVEGKPKSLLLEFIDITLEKRAAHQLRLAAMVYDNAGEGIVVSDADGNILSVNSAFERITGFEESEALGRNIGELMPVREDSQPHYQQLWSALEEHGFWQGELWRRRKDGYYFPQWLTITRIHEGDRIQNVEVMSDISDVKESQRKAEYLSTHDTLTGLANRALFQDRLERALNAGRRKDSMTGLLFMDLDRFKEVNDTLGHDVGDRLLVEMSRRVAEVVRAVDTVARLGGDEFAVVLEDVDVAELEEIAKRILASVRRPFIWQDKAIDVQISIGAAFAPGDGDDVSELSKAADLALYRAKEAGRDRVELYREEMQRALVAKLDMERRLREDLAAQRLALVFQPKFSCCDEVRPTGAEVLLRWHNAALGTVSPETFITLAESSQLIVDVDRYVLEHALATLSTLAAPELEMAVNISARSLSDPGFAEFVEKRLGRVQVTPRRLILEITERALVGEGTTALGNMHRLHALGVRFSVDDFGTGFSSLAYLKRLPIAELKIDKSFVDGLGGVDPGDESIALAIIRMAQSLGMKTVAEGVETEQQARWLREQRCDQLQGFLYSRPLALDAFRALLARGLASGDTGFGARVNGTGSNS